jgi:hypothetical protein
LVDDDFADDRLAPFFLRVDVFFFAFGVEDLRAGEAALRGAFFFAFTPVFFPVEAGFDRREDFFRAFVFFFAVPVDAVCFFAPDLAAMKREKGFETNLKVGKKNNGKRQNTAGHSGRQHPH